MSETITVEGPQSSGGTGPTLELLRQDRMPHIWCAGCGIGTTVNCFIRGLTQAGIDSSKLLPDAGIAWAKGVESRLRRRRWSRWAAIPLALWPIPGILLVLWYLFSGLLENSPVGHLMERLAALPGPVVGFSQWFFLVLVPAAAVALWRSQRVRVVWDALTFWPRSASARQRSRRPTSTAAAR